MKANSGYVIISVILGMLMLSGGVLLYLNYSYSADTLKEVLGYNESNDENISKEAIPLCTNETVTNCRMAEIGKSNK